MEQLTVLSGAFALVFLAEFGDKSQLVCMTMAARHRPVPILLGAVLAFAVLNALAVTVGVGLAQWLPKPVVLLIVALMFLWFGWQSLRVDDDEEGGDVSTAGKSLLVSAFLMIFMAELGDKTQLAVTGLAGVQSAVPVWIGATLALAATTAIGVWAGRIMLRYISLAWLHRASALLFLLFALLALAELVSLMG